MANDYRLTLDLSQLSDGLPSSPTSPGVDTPSGFRAGFVSGAKKAAAGFASVQSIRPFISMAMNMRTQAVNIVTASAQLSQKTSFVNGMLNTAVDVGMSAISGAMMAGATGLASTGAGAVVGLAIAAVGKGIGIAQEVNRLSLEQSVENVQLTELRTRGGVAFNQSRRGE